MKKILVLTLAAICVIGCLCFAACDDKPTGAGGSETQNGNNSENNIMYIKIGETTLTATLVENKATDALVEKLKTNPVTIEMSDYGGWEKVGDFGFGLPESNSQITAQPCDFVLYQGNKLVIFYGLNSWSYTKLGKIDGVSLTELKEILGNGSVTVTLTLEK